MDANTQPKRKVKKAAKQAAQQEEAVTRHFFQGKPLEITTVLEKHVDRPRFLKETQKMSGSIAVQQRELWRDLAKLEPNLSFTKHKISVALEMLIKVKSKDGTAFVKDKEIVEYKKTMTNRMRQHLRFISSTKKKGTEDGVAETDI